MNQVSIFCSHIWNLIFSNCDTRTCLNLHLCNKTLSNFLITKIWKEEELDDLIKSKNNGLLLIILQAQCFEDLDLNFLFAKICKHGHMKAFHLLLSFENLDPNDSSDRAFKMACEFGQTEIVKYFLDQNLVNPSDHSLSGIYNNGHNEVLKLIWTKDFKFNDKDPFEYEKNYIFKQALKNNDWEMIIFLWNRNIPQQTKLDCIHQVAYLGLHKEFKTLLSIEKDEKFKEAFVGHEVYVSSVNGGNIEIFNYIRLERNRMRILCIQNENENYNDHLPQGTFGIFELFEFSCRLGRMDFIKTWNKKFLIQLLRIDEPECSDEWYLIRVDAKLHPLISAITNGYYNVVKYLIEELQVEFWKDILMTMSNVIQCKNAKIFEYFFNHKRVNPYKKPVLSREELEKCEDLELYLDSLLQK